MEYSEKQPIKPDFEPIKSKLLDNNGKIDDVISIENSELFKPFKINKLQFKNHFAFINMDENDLYTEENFNFGNYYENVAKSNVALIFTGGVDNELINKKIDLFNKKDLLLFSNDINKIHSYGSKIFLQIKQFYGRGISLNKFLNKFNYSASFDNSYSEVSEFSVRISDYKCNEIIYDIKKIFNFAHNVGFDGVLLNGDLFNILGELSSVEFNRRIFGYYSYMEDFIIKILKSLKNDINDFNLFYSITIDSFLKEIFGADLKHIKTTYKIKKFSNFENVCNLLKKMVDNGVDGFIFNFGTYENEYLNVFNEFEGEYLFYDFYKEIKTYFIDNNIKNKFGDDVVIIYKDNVNTINKANLYLKNGIFNFFDATRQLYADNNYLHNIFNNKINRPCIKCGYCDYISKNYKLNSCLVNPNLFKENLNKVDILKNNKVAIIGCGLSGLMCASYLLERGFIVDIFEKNDILNKKRRVYEMNDFCKFTKKFNDYIEYMLIKNAKTLQIYLNNDIKSSNIPSDKEYAAIIIATGSNEKFLNIVGSVLKTVYSLNEILSKSSLIEKVNNFVIYAQSDLSIKFALYLLGKNKKVSLIFNNFEKIKNLSNDRYTYYFYELIHLNANIYIDSRVKKIEEEYIDIVVNKNINKKNIMQVVMNIKTGSKIKKQEKLISLDYELFVYEPELIENNKLYYDIISSGYKGDVFMIGNALKISSDADCIKSAYYVAKNI